MADEALSGLPVGSSVTDADLFYSVQVGASVQQTGLALRTYLASSANAYTALQTFGNNISFGGASVLMSSLTTGNVAYYNGSNWVNLPSTSLIVSPTNIQTGTATINVTGNAGTATTAGQIAVRGPNTLPGAPNHSLSLSTGNLIPLGDWHPIARGVAPFSAPNWDASSRNALLFPDCCKAANNTFVVSYVRCRQESSYTGDTTGVLKISPDGGATWSDEITVASASFFSGTATVGLGCPTIVPSCGMLLLTMVVDLSNGAPWQSYIQGSLDNGLTWTALGPNQNSVPFYPGVYSLIYSSLSKVIELNDGLGPIINRVQTGTLMYLMNGQNTGGNTNNDVIVIQSVDGAKTWTLRSTVYSLNSSQRYVESCWGRFSDGSIIAAHRNTITSNIDVNFSTDSGQTWTVPAFAFAGIAKPQIEILDDDTVVIVTRSTGFGSPLLMYTSRTKGTTWEQAVQLDTSTTITAASLFLPATPHFQYYAGVTKMYPGQVAVVYGAAPAFPATAVDIQMRYVTEGNARTPLADVSAKSLFVERMGNNYQIPQTPGLPIQSVSVNTSELGSFPLLAASVNALASKVNSLITQNVHVGSGYLHPLDISGCALWTETRSLTNTANDLLSAFGTDTTLHSNNLVDTVSGTATVGSWTISGGHIAATAGGSNAAFDWDDSVRDKVVEVQGAQPGSTDYVRIKLRGSGSTTYLEFYLDTTAGLLRLNRVVSGSSSQLDPGTWSVSGGASGQTVGLKASCNSTSLTLSVDPNVQNSIPSYTKTFLLTLSGSDATNFNASNCTKYGLLASSSNPTSFTTVDFEYGLSQASTIATLVNQVSGGISIGNLSQATLANRMLYIQNANLFGGNGYIVNNNNHRWISSASYTATTGPTMTVIVGIIPNTSGSSAAVYTAGSNNDKIGLSASVGNVTDNFAISNNGNNLQGPAFSLRSTPVYPQGPFVLMLTNPAAAGQNSQLIRDGKVIISGLMGTNGKTISTFGDTVNSSFIGFAAMGEFIGIPSATQINELLRYIRMEFGVKAINYY